MDHPIRKRSGDDLVVWPDGTTCFYSELSGFNHKSDDFQILTEGSPEWELVAQEAGWVS